MNNFRQVTRWGDLSERAQNVLEWSEDVHTGQKNVISIRVGMTAHLSASRNRQASLAMSDVVDQALFNEIHFYVANAENEDQYPFLLNVVAEDHIEISSDMPPNSMVCR